ncbi:histidinol phosphate phosphatase domain-containing protein [uncultured Methanobrevibacter sp.]|uniref:histidinol phosphate phosphatase domain-containing protein n=1 Tax=uncultured Methanobrevibacter sp. TaxID=253161 RepID=UPI0026E006F7|nr:histidinol phosphate phosphatase domain-containing protein [uncultured Methanobrevibacter sp.]
MNKRIDLHMHTLFSDGELLPSELARRAVKLNHEAIAITDHIDASNVDNLPQIQKAVDDVNENWDIDVILGAEITHTPVESIDKIARKARKLGAELIVVHGETLNEPVVEGTNYAAVNSKNVDILAHPGLLSKDEAEIALKNDVYIEITARNGHSLSNGHVANVCREVGNKMIINTDTHSPDNIITFERSKIIGLGAGLNESEVEKAIVDNPHELIERL